MPIKTEGKSTAKICPSVTLWVANTPTIAKVATDRGLATIEWEEATQETERGRSGRTPASLATSEITGRRAIAMNAVPVKVTKENKLLELRKLCG